MGLEDGTRPGTEDAAAKIGIKRYVLIGLGVFYLISMFGFTVSLIGEITGYRFFYLAWKYHEMIELMILVSLHIGAYIAWQSYKLLLARSDRMKSQLRVASGAFQAALDQLFNQWGLSDAEKEVALLTVKGMSITEIADLRETTSGTIKAQSSAIYKKAGVGGRAQLVSSLIEDLLH